MRPFIQLFRTPRGQYVYDVNKSELLPITEDSFTFLQKCMDGTANVAESGLDEIKALISTGYLKTQSAVKDICHPYIPYLKQFLNRKISKITLQVTQSCNLRCKYCIYSEDINQYQRSHSNKRMSIETAKKAIEFLYDHSVDSESVNIGFYGGEPLLELPLIKQAVQYARNLFDGKKITFAITTNGTLLTSEAITYLAAEDISLTISLDGPKQIHDKCRVFEDGRGSFDILMNNIDMMRRLAPEYYKKLQFSMVMDPANDFDCINDITVAANDFNDHSFLASIVEREANNQVLYSEDYIWKSEYHHFLALLSVIGRFPNEEVSALSKRAVGSLFNDSKFAHMFGPLHPTDAPSGPCIPGQMRLFINAEGSFFPCERVSEQSKVMCIGSLDKGFDTAKAKKILDVGSITKEICRNCWSFRYCMLCAKRADDGGECLSPKRKLANCENVRASTYEKLRKLLLLNEIDLYYSTQAREKEGVM